MYFVDRVKIDNTLSFFHKQIELFESQQQWSTNLEKASLERCTHLMIEMILDIGNDMIDGFIMRDPGSYEDIIDILTDELVITPEMSIGLKEIISCRKQLVQEYLLIDHPSIQTIFQQHMDSLKKFTPSVKKYLEHELGPVSAFKN